MYVVYRDVTVDIGKPLLPVTHPLRPGNPACESPAFRAITTAARTEFAKLSTRTRMYMSLRVTQNITGSTGNPVEVQARPGVALLTPQLVRPGCRSANGDRAGPNTVF